MTGRRKIKARAYRTALGRNEFRSIVERYIPETDAERLGRVIDAWSP